MRARLERLVARLRAGGVAVSTAEAIDAARGVRIAGIGSVDLRESLAATLIKDIADREFFDEQFDQEFGLEGQRRPRRKLSSGSNPGAGGRTGEAESGVGRPRRDPEPQNREPRNRVTEPGERRFEKSTVSSRRRNREILATSFDTHTAADIEAGVDLAQAVARQVQARWRRRTRRGARGILDLRATLRRATATGGTPVSRVFRRRRPGRPDIVLACDISHSVSAASRFLLSTLAGFPEVFSRVRTFGFIDRLFPIAIEKGRLVYPLDVDPLARSDFGRVLLDLEARRDAGLGRHAILLILGDARNNRRPARQDALRRIRRRSHRLIWLNPETPARWNTGDSVMASYASECDAVLAASTPGQLIRALEHTLLP